MLRDRIDAFVDSLDMEALGFQKAKPAQTGRPAYDPRDLLKLYLYGYLNRNRSSRSLMRECRRNIELFYLMGGLKPDFRTIVDFRKDNAKAIRNTFRAFGKLCIKLNLYNRELLAVDGTKVRAVNSKDNCYNQEVLEKKLAHIDEKTAAYSESAEEDIFAKAEYIEKVLRDSRLAYTWYTRLRDQIARDLSFLPYKFQLYPASGWAEKGIREYVFRNDIVLYSIDEASAVVIIHAVFTKGKNISEDVSDE